MSLRPPSFAERRPYVYALLLTVMILAVYLVAGTIVTILKLPTLWIYAGGNIILFILAMVFLSAVHGGQRVGLRPLKNRRDWGIYWLAFVPPLVNLAFGFVYGFTVPSIGMALAYLGLALLVGFNEEVFFRGLMLRPLLIKGAWIASILTAVLFGVAHALNILAGALSLAVYLQIGYALAIGFCFAAMAIRTGSIWPLILAHFLTDFFGFLAGGLGATQVTNIEMIVAAAYIVLFTAYGVFLIVTRKR